MKKNYSKISELFFKKYLKLFRNGVIFIIAKGDDMIDIDKIFDEINRKGFELGYNAEEAGEDKIELCFTDDDNDRLGLLKVLIDSIKLGREVYKAKHKTKSEIKKNNDHLNIAL